jgi:hypothetical protein
MAFLVLLIPALNLEVVYLHQLMLLVTILSLVPQIFVLQTIQIHNQEQVVSTSIPVELVILAPMQYAVLKLEHVSLFKIHVLLTTSHVQQISVLQ